MSKRWIANVLLKYAESMDDWVKPVDGIRRFSLPRANSFLVGVLLDRQINTKRAWDAADWIVDSIYDKELRFWEAVRALESRKIRGFMRYGWGGKAFHRNWKTMAENLQKCADIIIEEYGGDPRKIWNGERCISSVRKRFEELPGIGRALSRMAVLILVRNYGLLGGKDALPRLDIKPDDLLMRVFKRTGLVPVKPSFEDFLVAARQLNPDFPAALDAPAWDIGRKFCAPRYPKCGECPLDERCPRVGL